MHSPGTARDAIASRAKRSREFGVAPTTKAITASRMAARGDGEHHASRATCRCSATRPARHCTPARSTSTTPACPVSRAPSPPPASPCAHEGGVKPVGGDGALRHSGPGRGSDHRAGSDPDRPLLRPEGAAYGGPRRRGAGRPRTVRWHCERRVLLNGASTVVFRWLEQAVGASRSRPVTPTTAATVSGTRHGSARPSTHETSRVVRSNDDRRRKRV